ncbi:MAG: ABC transporter permease [Clostridiales bacterium]|nr:ABC transporter permease [Clostridiales bacterium]
MKKKTKTKRSLSLPSKFYMLLIFIFLYAPIAVMILFSFNESSSTYVFSGFSTKWWQEMFQNSAAVSALKNTLLLAVVNSVCATVLGSVGAIGIFGAKSRLYKRAMMSVTNVPMMNPEIVTGISMMLLFVFAGTLVGRADVLGFWTLLIAHVTFSLPYVILNVLPKLRQFDMNVYEAAVDLGCTGTRAFFKVVLPGIASGILTGFVMSFTLSIDDFIISYFTNGPGFQTLPIYIFSMTKKRVKPDMYALSALIFFVILVLLIIMNAVQAKALKKKGNKF